MEKTACSRRELLDRWIGIQDEEDDDDPSPSKQWHIRQAKQNWFSDCYAFLFNLPEVSHIWCGYSDLMGPLLETFHNYFNDKSNDSPLKILWKRISVELEQCTQCIFLYHQAQELFNIEYEFDAVGQLLKVLRRLDEERVTEHIEKINARMKHGEYNADAYNVEVISLMFEVLTYPILLEDHILVKEFQVFLEAVDSYHDVALAGSQQYMGVYALLFLKSGRSRAIGFRLAGCMGKLRSAADLDPLQPLLKKYIGFLGNEVLPSTLDDSRPRVQLERTTVWIGVKTLLGFLEAPAYEEGILEKYPVFLSIVLNHVSGDTLDFSYAVACLRVSFEILGSKLWLRTALSPSVMRNTLLGQCFHTRIEKSHKEIFDLFLPFLQSLEAYLDGEHEKQRRNLLYFLLHQVTQSSNFSDLMRKNACKIALLIVHRGYKMVPPCPPFECAHMWGPTLVNSFKNMSLHNSLRQPAFDLITTIIISDASALISLKQKISTVYKSNLTIQGYLVDEENEFTFSEDVEENDNSCWTEFNMQSKLASSESSCWVCIPMLWIDSLIDIDPAILPICFSKALFWVLSHISVLEMNSCVDTSLAVRDWLSIHASEISSSFGWQIPTGFNDGGEGKESRNSVRALSLCTPLLRALKRLAAEFILQLEKIELQKQWTWEPRMAESLILSLVDPDDIVRKTGKIILEHLSNERLLTAGLQFLCSTSSSMSAMLVGLQFIFKQVHCYSMMDSFHCLHHVFFVTGKLLKELVRSPIKAPPVSLSSQGGFLPESLTDHAPSSLYECQQIHVNIKSWEKFSYLLSAIMWDPLLKCLVEGKELINNTKCQMTCVRLLETFPAIFERLSLSMPNLSENIVHLVPSLSDFNWLSDLVDWRRSHLVVVNRHWKQCILSFLSIFKDLYGDLAASIISTIEKIIQSDTIILDYIQEQMLCLISSLSHLYSSRDGRQIIKQKSLPLETFSWKNVPDLGASLFLGSSSNSSVVMNEKSIKKEIVVLSDDEADNEACMEVVASCRTNLASHLHEGFLPTMGKGLLLDDDKESMIANSKRDMLEPFPSGIFVKDDVCSSEEEDQLVMKKSTSNKESVSSKIGGFHMQERDYSTEVFKSSSLVKSSHKATNASSKYYLSLPKNPSNKVSNTVPHSDQTTAMVKKLVQDIGDPLELVLDNISRPKPVVSKLTVFAPKRKVIQLQMPENNKSFSLNRMDISSRRLKPPKLDVWYKSILEMDYFVTVGLQATDENEKTTSKLTEVPLHFQSSDQYVKIFQPLVLEEFKAQLHNSFLESPVDDEHCSSLSVVSVERIDDFHMIRGRLNEKQSTTSIGCIENDLVLLTKDPPENSVQNAFVLGKVERREKSDKNFSAVLVIRFYLPDASSRLNRVKRLLIERSKWFLSRVMSLTPQLREFQALSSLNSIPMLHIILNPVDHSYGHAELQKVDLSKLSQPMQNMLKSSFNDSQLQAVSVAIRSQASKKIELSLIQGPPGTGKTRTIVSIVSALLSLQRVSRNCSSNTLTNTTSAANVLSNPIAHLTHTATIARAWQDATCAKQLLKDADKASTIPIDCASKGRILICAQSNAAVDELVSRINEGINGNDGKIYKPFIVRVGNAKTVHPDSLPIFIDTLVELRLAEEITTMGTIGGGNDSNAETSISLRVKLEKLVERIRYYESKRAKSKDGDASMKDTSGNDISKEDDNEEVSDAAIGAKLNKLYREKRLIYQDLLSAQAQEKKITEESRARKHKIRKSILREAEIVITTLSGCGGDLYGICYGSTSSGNSGRFTDQFFFDVVVIDEAAQALEPATLIPLQLLKSNGAKCIMVGDPKQLSATVLSSVASQFLYECSMFERLQKAGHPVILLTEQYRMHPEICSFPSLHFYDNKLLNGVSAASKSAQFHEHAYLGPYTFYDIVDGCEHHGKSSSSLSLYNKAEVEAAISIMRSLRKRYSSDFASRKIGIITPYKSQLQLLRSHFSSAFGSSAVYDMQFNTVDGFQGREVDILLLSTVRSSISVSKSAASIGFVADIRRMNVALTRAKISLWIVGNARTLQTNPHWAALIQNAKERNLFVSVHRPYDSLFKESTNKNDMAKSTQEEAEQDENGDAFGKKAKLAKRFGLAASDGISRVTNDKQRDGLANTLPKNSNSSSEGQKCSLKEKAAKNVSANAAQRNRACENTLEKSQRAADKEKPPKPLAKDLLAIRKQQRDDIEALLPSALISSSKKTGKPSSSSSASKKPRN